MEPDPAALILDTGYQRFETTCGIVGLAKIVEKRLDVLAVQATKKGKGQFRAFITHAKQEFEEVCVWEDWNPALAGILTRYGFKKAVRLEDNNEIISGWRWLKT